MNKLKNIILSSTIPVILIVFLIGCGYTLKYELAKKDIFIPGSTQKFNVVVATFFDQRPPEERIESERKKKQFSDLGDYTYDKEFKGKVNEEITKMIAEHLNFSKVFSKVTYVSALSDGLTEDYVDSLRSAGFDAILTGDILDFYGYYDSNELRAIFLMCLLGLPPIFLIDPYKDNETYIMGEKFVTTETDYGLLLLQEGASYAGMYIGQAIECSIKRKIEWYTELSIQLVRTSDYEIIWEDTAIVKAKEFKSLPVSESNKFKVAVNSLREAVNQMVKRLSEVSLSQE